MSRIRQTLASVASTFVFMLLGASAHAQIVYSGSPTLPATGFDAAVRADIGNFVVADPDPEYVILGEDSGTFRLTAVERGASVSYTPEDVSAADPSAMLVGDCDGDGDDDVVVATPGEGFRVFESDGFGGFSFLAQYQPQILDSSNLFQDADVSAMDWIDMNDDGFLDLVLGFDADISDENFSQIWFNFGFVGPMNQGCTFSRAPTTIGSETYGGHEKWGPDHFSKVLSLHTFDFNFDGRKDIALGTENYLYVYVGRSGIDITDPDTWFWQRVVNPTSPPPVYSYFALSSGDINRDGLLDLIGLSHVDGMPSTAEASYFIASDASLFTPTLSRSLDPSGWLNNSITDAMKVMTADIDEDGWVDIVSAYLDSSNQLELRVHFHSGEVARPEAMRDPDGIFRATGQNTDPRAVVLDDFDSDGDLDLLIHGWFSSPLYGPAYYRARPWFGSPPPIERPFGFGLRRGLTPVSGHQATALDVGDIDNDGRAEAVFANIGDLWAHQTGGAFPLTSSPARIDEIRIIDFDGDRRLDIAISDGASTTVGIYQQQPDGAFGFLGTVPVGPGLLVDMQWADFDQDGLLDMVYTTTTPELRIHLGKNMPGGGATPLFPGGEFITIADFDEDGVPDVVTSLASGGAEYFAEFNGTIFDKIDSIPLGSGVVGAIESCDVTADGRVDLIMATKADVGAIFENNSTPTIVDFPKVTDIGGGADNFSDIVCADLNNDGFNDVFVSHKNMGGRSIYWESNAGTWDASLQRIFEPNTPPVVVMGAGDVDGDGDIDIVESTNFSGLERAWRENGVVTEGLLDESPTVGVMQVGGIPQTLKGRSGRIFRTSSIPIRMQLFDRNTAVVPEVILEYSLRGSSVWQAVEVRDPERLEQIPVVGGSTEINVEWVLPRGAGNDHIRSDEVRVRATIVQPNSAASEDQRLTNPVRIVSGPISIWDPCAGHACGANLCFEGDCFTGCTDPMDCPPGTTCYQEQGTCNNGAGPCMEDIECGGGLCIQDPGRCDTTGDPNASITCPLGLVEYAGSCYDPCASNDDCTPPQLCFNNVCQTDACSGVNCPLGQVCYQGSCFSATCADDGDCIPPELCYDNHCATDPCDGVICPLGQICFEGSCYDPCSAGVCTAPNVCFDNRCYDPADPCDGVVCGSEETCQGGICALACTVDDDCDAYSTAADGVTLLDCDGIGTDDPDCLLCFNGRCRPPVDPCDSMICPLGELCHEGSCFETCASDSECTTSGFGACYDDGGTPEDPICLAATGPCDTVTCPADYVCHEGSCYLSCGSRTLCMSDSECPSDETCQNGFCVRCNPETEQCYQNYCAPSACEGVFCPLGELCYAGSCYPNCETAACSPGTGACFVDRCADAACDDVICPLGQICSGGSCFDPCSSQADCGGGVEWFFTDVSRKSGLVVPGDKEGGASWADFDSDGDLDVVVNTNDGTVNSRLYQNNGDGTFTDVTFFGRYAPWMGRVNTERSVVWGDYNNDGHIDLARNTGRRLEIFANKGPSGTPAYGLGVGTIGEPDQVFRGWPLGGTFNTEGMAWIDFDGDADLDLMVNSQSDIVMLENTGARLEQTAFPSDYGLLTGAAASDYCLAADLDVDFDVDIVCRVDRSGAPSTVDIWFNIGGSFAPITSVDLEAENANKGGVAACDLNNDGLFDLVWTDGDDNVVLEQVSPGDFVATNRLEVSSGVMLPNDIDGVDCGDVDNDGDVDVLLAGDNEVYLFLNESTGGLLLFREDGKGLVSSEDIESANFVDYDLDGDLDVFLNQDRRTQLFENNRGESNLLRVRLAYTVGSRIRDAIGATLTVRDPDGNILGVREVNGGKGHGSQSQLFIHYGLPNGDQVPYELDVRFPSGERVRRCVLPSSLGSPNVVIRATDSSDLTACADPDWETRVRRPSDAQICWGEVVDDDGSLVRPSHCSADACEGIQCPGDQICFRGGCFDFCTDDLECDPGSICYNNRCVDEEDQYCDGIVCPLGDVCYRGECFAACEVASDCPTGEFCYIGRCAPEDCSGISGLCESDEVCYRGTCFEDCSADPSVCPRGESCYEGRCADDGCAALPDTYDAGHPFRRFGRRLASSQHSTPWHWPRPIITSDEFEDWVDDGSGIESNEVPARGRARVAMVLDPDLSDSRNPDGQYVLYLTQGFDTGAGLQRSTVAQYNVRVRRAGGTSVIWDNSGEAHHMKSDLDEELYVVRLTADTDRTAGIAIGPFPTREAVDWSITIQASLGGDIKAWEIYNPDTRSGFALREDEPLRIRNVPLSPDLYITPSSGMPCDVDPSLARGICGRGTASCGRDGRLTCDQTVIRWPYELCDGRDNNCNGIVDENVRFPVSDWRQGAGGWSFFVTTDTLSDIHDFMNFRQRGSDDRRGSTAVTGYGGVGIQGDKKTLTTMHRDVTTGLLTMPLVHGRYMFGAVAAAYNDHDIYMTLALDQTYPDNVFIAFHDDLLPVRTNDEIPDSYNATTKEVGLDWRLAKPTAVERESDSVAIRPLLRPWDMNPAVSFSMEFDGTLGGTNSESGPDQLEWRLYQPRLAETNLRRVDELDVRTTLRPSLTSVCAASDTSPSGCVLGRYQCVGGRVTCSSATDGACDLCFDSDGDGFERYDAATCPDGTDCNDSNPDVFPGAEELCDGLDNDCDGEVDVTTNGAVVFGETLSCVNGDDRCGPAECGFAFTCVCPDGPEDPTDPSSGVCSCASSLEADVEVAEPLNSLDSRDEAPQEDSVPQSDTTAAPQTEASGCATGSGEPSNLLVVLLALFMLPLMRRRR